MRGPSAGGAAASPRKPDVEQEAQEAYEAWSAILKMEADHPGLAQNNYFLTVRADMQLVWLTAFAKLIGQPVGSLAIPDDMQSAMKRLGLAGGC